MSLRYMYHCAQIDDRHHAPSKSQKPGIKHRDKESMETFDCSGWLHVTLSDMSDLAFIRLEHHTGHVPYCPIDILDDVRTYVCENIKLMPAQVCAVIINPNTVTLTLCNL
jgi:hypothetical protein